LGFQHYLVMLGTTVLIPTYLVPQMGGGNVSYLLRQVISMNIYRNSVFLSDLYSFVVGREGKDGSDITFCFWT